MTHDTLDGMENCKVFGKMCTFYWTGALEKFESAKQLAGEELFESCTKSQIVESAIQNCCPHTL